MDINDQILGGTNISHILNLKISNEQTNEVGKQIRKLFLHNILNRSIPLMIPFGATNIIVDVIWTMVNARASSTYYCTYSPFTDEVVQEHAKLVITAIGNQIRAQRPDFGNTWKV